MRIHLHPQARALALPLALTGMLVVAPAALAAERKPPSACVGLEQNVCADRAECYWRKATTLKTGKVRRAHCRIKRSASKTPPA